MCELIGRSNACIEHDAFEFIQIQCGQRFVGAQTADRQVVIVLAQKRQRLGAEAFVVDRVGQAGQVDVLAVADRVREIGVHERALGRFDQFD